MELKKIRIQGHRTAIIVLSVAALSAQAHASSRGFPFGNLERTMTDAAKRASDSSNGKRANPDLLVDRCVDLSGDWAGTCSYPDSEPNEDSISIRQKGCSTFEFPGNLFIPKIEIGNPTFIEASEEPMSLKGVSTLAWNDSQTKLFGMSAATTSVFPVANFSSFIITQEIWISDDILYTREGPTSEIFTPFGVYPNVTPGSFCQYHRRAQ